MNSDAIVATPRLLDHLAAAYALGTLRGGARRRFEALARQSPTLRAAALVWQERLSSMTELQPTQSPGPRVWQAIAERVAAERRPAAVLPAPEAASPAPAASLAGLLQQWQLRVRRWQVGALVGGLATAAAVLLAVDLQGRLADREGALATAQRQGRELLQQNVQLAAQLQAQPDIRYVAVLADDKAGASLLATFDPKHGRLTLKRVGSFQEGPDQSLQLWALPTGAAPRSLGVLGTQEVVRLLAAERQVQEAPMLAVSLEPKGGVPGEGGPTGPVLFKGAVLQTPL